MEEEYIFKVGSRTGRRAFLNSDPDADLKLFENSYPDPDAYQKQIVSDPNTEL
jgi:hypothetical protein